MKYWIECQEGNPDRLIFEPDFVSSSGDYWAKAGKKALYQFPIDGWSLRSEGELLLVHVLGKDNPPRLPGLMVADAQACVTKIMDKLVEWNTIRKILEVSN